MVVFAILLVHLGTIINNQSYLSVGLSQSTRTALIATGRGTIYDRNGAPLTNASRRYRGVLVPELEQLYRIRGDVTEQEYLRLTEEIKQQSLVVAELSKASYSGQKLCTFSIPKRYDSSVSCAHLIGYLDEAGLSGQTGIEKAYNDLLEQYSGKITVTYEVNGIGACQTEQTLKVSNTLDRCSGGVQLTVDAEIQQLLDSLAPRYITKGAAVILSPDTGEILAATSLPAFHPEQIQESIDQEDGALVNRLLSRFDCGSVFKIVTAAAALERGVTSEQAFTCAGEMTVGNTVFHCHQRLGHQEVDMNAAFAQSCNLYFIQLAQQIGGEAILDTAKALGLCDAIDLAEGLQAPAALLPELEELYPATLANLSFGQGELLLSPLHVARLTATVANGGTLVTPTVVRGTVDAQGNLTPAEKGRGEPVLSNTTAAQLRWMMEQVVSDGTGTGAQPDAANAAGKTGTAETGQLNDDAPVVQSWFTGYFPTENPQYVITILAEDAENNGSNTQALFRELCNELY